jgi:hypothetical protein
VYIIYRNKKEWLKNGSEKIEKIFEKSLALFKNCDILYNIR